LNICAGYGIYAEYIKDDLNNRHYGKIQEKLTNQYAELMAIYKAIIL